MIHNSAKSWIASLAQNENRITSAISTWQDNFEEIQELVSTCAPAELVFKTYQNNTPALLALKRYIYYILHRDDVKASESYQVFTIIQRRLYGVDVHEQQLADILQYCKDPLEYRNLKKTNSNVKLRDVYTANSQGSAELNSSILEYMYTNLPFYDNDLLKRYTFLLDGFSTYSNKNGPITVFHGTPFPIHSNKSFVTYAFFSTTVNLNVAMSYGECIYIIQVADPNFVYLNLQHDTHGEILLPMGTYIEVQFEIGKFIFCKVVNTAKTKEHLATMRWAAQTKSARPIDSVIANHIFLDHVKSFKTRSSSKMFVGTYNNDRYVIKQPPILKSTDYIHRRLLNEVLAAKLYNLYNCNTFEYVITQHNDISCLASKIEPTISYTNTSVEFAQEVLQGFIVDCILANWDVMQMGNIASLNNKVIRTDVGGALAYRARGEFKVSFFNNFEIKEHVTMLPSYRKHIALLNLEDIVELMYAKAKAFDTKRFNEIQMEVDVPEPYIGFVTKIVEIVKQRHDYYIRHFELIKNQILNSGVQIGGNALVGSIRVFEAMVNEKSLKHGGKIEKKKRAVKKRMKVITWNVNGLRAVLGKDKSGSKTNVTKNVLLQLIEEEDPDILCLQETKCPNDLEPHLPFIYKNILASSTRKGYSGVAVFSKTPPLSSIEFKHNEEGRVICLEFERFHLINTYTPNSKPDLARLDYRINTWEKEIRSFVNSLSKPVIFVSDFNVAPTEKDIHTAKGNERAHGFTIEERTAFSELLDECQLVDAFRLLHPTEKKYTWFSNFAKSRERNKGWRIDHVLVSKNISNKIASCEILSNFYGSDHIPVACEIDI